MEAGPRAGSQSRSAPAESRTPSSSPASSSFSAVGVRWSCAWYLVGTQPYAPIGMQPRGFPGPVAEGGAGVSLGLFRHLPTQVHCAPTVRKLP